MDREKLIRALMGDQPNAAFGTGSPGEEAQKPSGLAALFGGAYEGLGGLAKRAIGNSQTAMETGYYNPAPVMEAATSVMGGGMPMAERGALGMAGGRLTQLPSVESLSALPHPSAPVPASTIDGI